MPSTTEAAPATQQEEAAEPVAEAPRQDSIVICHPGPAYTAPSLSSFVLKMETYLRMADIPYTEEFSLKKSSKGKTPFIKHNGKEVTDTNFIIPYLNEKFGKNLNASLNDQEKAISLAFKRLVEENAYWALVHYRWIDNWSCFSKMLPLTGMRKKLLPVAGALWYKPSIKSNLQGHGMGRHSSEEIQQIMEKDIRALSAYLGAKQFFMGDEPTEIDATLFGFLAQILYAAPDSPFEKLVKENLQNLSEYGDRMREKYWADWDKKVVPEKKKEEEPAPEKKEDAVASNGEKQEETNGEKTEGDNEKATGDANGVEKTEEAAPATAEENSKPEDGGDAQTTKENEDAAGEQKEQ